MDKHNFEPGKIDKCQICNSINLIEVMKLGDQPLANSLIKIFLMKIWSKNIL